MNMKFKDKNNKELNLGDVCRFFWNPILNEESSIFEFQLPIEYLHEFAAYGFIIRSKKNEQCNVSLYTIAKYSSFGIEKIEQDVLDENARKAALNNECSSIEKLNSRHQFIINFQKVSIKLPKRNIPVVVKTPYCKHAFTSAYYNGVSWKDLCGSNLENVTEWAYLYEL